MLFVRKLHIYYRAMGKTISQIFQLEIGDPFWVIFCESRPLAALYPPSPYKKVMLTVVTGGGMLMSTVL